MAPDVSIVILNFKVRDLVLRLLASIFEHTHGVTFEVIVVDNASNDGIAEAVRGQFPTVQTVVNSANLGFAAGCNVGGRLAKGRYLLLLNPDTELRTDAITKMIRFAEQHPQAGVVGPKIVNPDGTWQPSVRAFPSLLDQASIMLKLHHVWRGAPWLRRYFCDNLRVDTDQQVDQVVGASFLITPQARQSIGLLDERYFIWFEEVDYCKMVRNKGFEVWYTPQTEVVHYGGQSFGQVFAPRKQRYMDQSLIKYFQKHGRPISAAVVYLLHPVAMFLAWLIGTLGMRRKTYSYS